ncbi:tail fiber protein [Marixanthomonas spongiae]|uniref:Uncharacterized protein n=1 Tax=Marixanthomonas spongiae TaxID=2174845 RepID=A0A2U0I5B4_9FLAO|nr:tail fiber protein [Marixanthomonas spongiae]PVW16298.1 hypothetical protein DDV96_03265 [Marixanthomonas spongiae]
MKNTFILLMIIATALTMNAQRNPFKNLTETNGKIGIGTERPDELLTVKGKIHTQEVLVDLQGAVAPDYVFEQYFTSTSEMMPNYKLITLPELEAYIKKHHHLPEIPSAETMQTEGMSLKEMNLLLLKKVEELTLYTLQQQKEIEKLKEKVNTQQ